jgi:hypothetical protein
MYGLRKIRKNGKNDYNAFVWPLKVGAEVVAPDWNPEPECGGGLHCLPNAKGQWGLLSGEYWTVLEFNEKDMVKIDGDKCKVKKCKIVFLSENPKGMLKFFNANKFNSETAFLWAYYIGDRKIMIDRVVSSYYAYEWAADIGNKKIMRDRITNSNEAYKWALHFGDRKIMIDRITNSLDAFLWAKNIGDQEIMINRINNSKDAYYWALYLGDRDVMIDRISDPYYAYCWTKNIGDWQRMLEKFPELGERWKPLDNF